MLYKPYKSSNPFKLLATVTSHLPPPIMSFLSLPAELRIKIYHDAIIDAGYCRCTKYHDPVLDMSRIPQLTGIGPLPLLFVNKQIAHEIMQMLYSSLKPLVIDGYCFKDVGYENTRLSCWKPFPGGLPRHRYLFDFLRKIDIVVDLEGQHSRFVDGTTYDFRLPRPAIDYAIPHGPPVSEPTLGLLQYLRSFASLSKLQIIIEIPRKSRDTPPRRDKLSEFLAFHEFRDLREVQVVLRFELGQRFHDVPSRKVLSEWTNTWIECLTQRRCISCEQGTPEHCCSSTESPKRKNRKADDELSI